MLRGEDEACFRWGAERQESSCRALRCTQSTVGRAPQASFGVAKVSACDQVWRTTQPWLTRVECRDRGWQEPEYLHRLAARGTADGRFGDRLLRCMAQ